MRSERNLFLGTVFALGAGALWGLVFLSPKIAGDFSPLQLSAARYLAYGVLAAALLLPRWGMIAKAVGKAEWIGLVRLSLCGNIIYYLFLAASVQMAGVAAASLILGCVPVVVTLVGSRESDAVPLRDLVPSLVLAVAGVGLIGWEALSAGAHASASASGAGESGVGEQMLGILFGFVALAAWSAYVVGNSRWLVRLSHISSHEWSLLTGVVTGALALVLTVAALIVSDGDHGTADWVRFWGISLAVALGASVIGNGLWNRASRQLPLTMMGQMIIFETLFALLYGFLWEGRWPTPLEWVACVCLVAGVLWCANIHGRKKRALTRKSLAAQPSAAE